MVLQNLYLFACAADIFPSKNMPAVFVVTQNIGCSLLPLFGKDFLCKKNMITTHCPGGRSETRLGFPALHQRLYLLSGHARPDALPSCWRSHCPEEDFGEIKIMKSQNPLIDEPADDAAEAAHTETQPDSARSDTRALTVETQKITEIRQDMHGVRFDAYIKSGNVWAEVEMQTVSNLPLGKRARYYQSNMDLDCLRERCRLHSTQKNAM